jgi:hypothetical protein
MAQRSDYIRQDIESTRASLEEKLDTLETKARQTFDLNHQVSEHPWLMVGAAVAAGYVLGSMGGNDEWYDQPMSTDYNQFSGTPRSTEYLSTPQTSNYSANYSSSSSQSSGISSMGSNFLSQFDDEINMLKTAAVTTLTNLLRDSIREYVPALGQQLDQEAKRRGLNRSTAPGSSMDYSSTTATNYEGIPETTSYGSNTVSRQSEQGQPYYPPGSSSASTSSHDYVKTYHPPTETTQERTVGDESTRY